MARVRFARAARGDIQAILRHLADVGGHGPADDFARSIDRLERTLATHPRAYSARPTLGRAVRVAVVGAYLVIYEPRNGDNDVFVLRILHGRRDIGADFRRLT